jgi:hypothetical protein
MLALGASIVVSSLLSTALEPINKEIARQLNKTLKREQLPISEAIESFHKHIIDEPTLREILYTYGLDDNNINRLLQITKPIISVADIISAYRHNEINEEEYINLLKLNGVDEKRRRYFEIATKVYPSLSDLVRFAVREVFNPSVVERFKYAEDMPAKFIEEAKKTGLDEEYAKMYWFAHWELPSVSMGIEMFRRGIISKEEFEELLKLHDVAPAWRDKIIHVLYELPTRVDLRRMYRIGVVDEQYVYNTYIKLGYDSDTAKALTKFTVLTEGEEERNLSKSEILNMFEEGVIDEERTLHLIKAIGYSESSAKLIVSTKKIEISRKRLKDNIDDVKNRFIANEITEEKAHDDLISLGLSESKVVNLLKQFKRDKVRQTKLLDKDEYIKAFKVKAISEDELLEYLQRLGYDDRHIQILLGLHGIKVQGV